MSWWRAYDESVDDPKLQRMPGELFKAWFNLMCLTSRHDGKLPTVADIAFSLRKTASQVEKIIADLRARGLIDETDGTLHPHNWNGRQFKSDVSTDRVKEFRKRKGNAPNPVPRNVSETPPEQSRDRAETEAEQKEADATASRDIRADLFGPGLQALASMTGKTPDSCRSLVGKWLKSVNDEAIHVLAAIEDAARNRIADPVPWINRRLKPHEGNGHGKRTVHDAASDLLDRVRALDEPGPDDLRDGTGEGFVRRLPAR